MPDLTRTVEFIPGFDRRHPEPAKNYGINGGKWMFVVSGPLGAVHFVCGGTWYPQSAIDHLCRHYINDGREVAKSLAPTGYDVGYHSPTPTYEDQSQSQESCEWLGGKPCYSDGSALRSDEWMQHFLKGGTKWLWPALEQEYRERFESPTDGASHG